MYSNEIKDLLIKKNYLITIDDYFRIINTSYQVDKIKYNHKNNEFEISTNDNFVLSFKIEKMHELK